MNCSMWAIFLSYIKVLWIKQGQIRGFKKKKGCGIGDGGGGGGGGHAIEK